MKKEKEKKLKYLWKMEEASQLTRNTKKKNKINESN